MTPRSAPGRPGSDPRRHHELPGTPQERPRSAPRETKTRPRGPETPRAPQERPKSRSEAVSEQPWWPPGADLAPKRLPEPEFAQNHEPKALSQTLFENTGQKVF